MRPSRPIGPISIGLLRPELDHVGLVARRQRSAADEAGEADLLKEIATRIGAGRERRFPFRPKVSGKRLPLALDRHLGRWRAGSGSAVFELLGRTLANEKAAPGLVRLLDGDADTLTIVLLDRSRHLVVLSPDAGVLGVNRAALDARGLTPAACVVAASIAHGLRAAARIRAGEDYEPEKERDRDVQNLLLLLVGVLGTEWEPEGVAEEIRALLAPGDPVLGPFVRYGRKLKGTLATRPATRLDDRVFRDGARFDRLPGREKLKVIAAGTLAWYGVLTLGLLRLPRRLFARRNPYYETAWWIFRSKPGGRRIVKGALLRRAGRALRSFRPLLAFEYLWSSWNPILAETCLRPVYRYAGGNRRPFFATIATYTYTAFVVHPLWITLTITGLAWCVGLFFPWIHEHTRITSRENLILHGMVIGFWMGIGVLVAFSKLLRRAG